MYFNSKSKYFHQLFNNFLSETASRMLAIQHAMHIYIDDLTISAGKHMTIVTAHAALL